MPRCGCRRGTHSPDPVHASGSRHSQDREIASVPLRAPSASAVLNLYDRNSLVFISILPGLQSSDRHWGVSRDFEAAVPGLPPKNQSGRCAWNGLCSPANVNTTLRTLSCSSRCILCRIRPSSPAKPTAGPARWCPLCRPSGAAAPVQRTSEGQS